MSVGLAHSRCTVHVLIRAARVQSRLRRVAHRRTACGRDVPRHDERLSASSSQGLASAPQSPRSLWRDVVSSISIPGTVGMRGARSFSRYFANAKPDNERHAATSSIRSQQCRSGTGRMRPLGIMCMQRPNPPRTLSSAPRHRDAIGRARDHSPDRHSPMYRGGLSRRAKLARPIDRSQKSLQRMGRISCGDQCTVRDIRHMMHRTQPHSHRRRLGANRYGPSGDCESSVRYH